MKTVTLNIDDKYADVMTITLIGLNACGNTYGCNVSGGYAFKIEDRAVIEIDADGNHEKSTGCDGCRFLYAKTDERPCLCCSRDGEDYYER